MVRRISLLLLTVAAMLSVATMNSHAQSVLTHHVREATRTGEAPVSGRLPASQIMQLDVVLPLRDQAGLDAFLKDVYDPTSFSYRRFLTPTEFTERFGPSQENYDAVIAFVKANGFEVTGGSRDGMEVQIKGPVSSVERHFTFRCGPISIRRRVALFTGRIVNLPPICLSPCGMSPGWTTSQFRIPCSSRRAIMPRHTASNQIRL